MSSALVPSSNTPAAFAQQGSLDWVALSNSSVQFSIGVLSRLSKAGIDALTLQVGRAICSNFALKPSSQERINDAIVKLKRHGSYGDIIWFGFGIKGIVNDLAATEEGLTLVALCAALSTTYDSLFASSVLRELCILSKAPESLTPALRQWRALTDLCAGILMSSDFTLKANGIRRLIQRPSSNVIERRCEATTYTALAEAISTLALISRKKLTYATFTGGLDCAWLAAFAESVLSLDVGIWDSANVPIYRSRDGAEELPQVTMIISDKTKKVPDKLLTTKASILPHGTALLQKNPANCTALVLNWHASWSTILHDVFGKDIDLLLSGEVGQEFALYLHCVSCLHATRREEDLRGYGDLQHTFRRHPVDILFWVFGESQGQGFLEHASKRLPELSTCLSRYSPRVHPGMPLHVISDLGEASLKSIRIACPCVLHRTVHLDQVHVIEATRSCLQDIIKTVEVFLWILLSCEIDDDVYPSVTGLMNLHVWQSRRPEVFDGRMLNFHDGIFSSRLPVWGIHLAFLVLSGTRFSQLLEHYSRSREPLDKAYLQNSNTLGRVGNGLCVVYCCIEDPTAPIEKIIRLRVSRGYIHHFGSLYKKLSGLKTAYQSENIEHETKHKEYDTLARRSMDIIDLHNSFTERSLHAVVQETNDETRLEFAYKMCYPGRTNHQTVFWLHFPALFRSLRLMIKKIACPNDCIALYRRDPLSRHYTTGQTFGVKSIYDEKALDRAQALLRDTDPSRDTWILVNEPAVYCVVKDQPLLLYTLLSQIGGCYLTSYTACLNCIVMRGIGTHILECDQPGSAGEQSFTTTLITPEGSQAVIKRRQEVFRNKKTTW